MNNKICASTAFLSFFVYQEQPPPDFRSKPAMITPSNKSIALGFGPALLQEYDEANRQKEELISRMIRQMRAQSKPVSALDGRPTHPKYSLLKLDPPPAEEEVVRRPQRREERKAGGYRERNEPRRARRSKTDRYQSLLNLCFFTWFADSVCDKHYILRLNSCSLTL